MSDTPNLPPLPGADYWMPVVAQDKAFAYYSLETLQSYALAAYQAGSDAALEEAATMADSCHPKASHRGIATAIRFMKTAKGAPPSP